MNYKSKTELLNWAQKHKWFKELYNTPQDPIWHAEGNAGIHTEMVLESYTGEDTIGELACLLHDISKPETTKSENGRIVAPSHATKGARKAQHILWGVLPAYQRFQITELIRLHTKPPHNWDGEQSVINTMVMKETVDLKTLYDLCQADIKGRICTDPEDTMQERLDLWFEMAQTLPETFTDTETGNRALLGNLEVLPTAAIHTHKKEFTVTFLTGLPGSGKDHFYQENLSDLPMISLDDIRRKNKIRRNDSKGNGQAIQLALEEFKTCLRKKQDCVINNTSITRRMRDKWLSIAKNYKASSVCHYIEPPKATLLTQNRNREYPIPERAIEGLFKILEIPHPLEMDVVNYHWNTEKP
jgi:predicted kinase